MDDALGLGESFEADMARHVAEYRCEWTETLNDPRRMERFVSFVNTDDADPSVVSVQVRGQRVPVTVRP